MSLKWKLENEWFSSDDVGIVKDKQILTTCKPLEHGSKLIQILKRPSK